jgi:hypothetical protein
MTLLTKDQILKSDDRAHEEVKTPEWGGSVRVIAMAACERDAFEASMLDSKGKGDKQRLQNFRARFIARCIVDVDDNRLFSDKDIVALGKKSAAPISRVFDACQKLNGMTDKDVGELEGN